MATYVFVESTITDPGKLNTYLDRLSDHIAPYRDILSPG